MIAATTSGLTSTAVTCQPWPANWTASGRPILPAPTTATGRPCRARRSTGDAAAASPWVHGLTRRARSSRRAGWRRGEGRATMRHSAASLEGRSDRSTGRRSAAAVEEGVGDGDGPQAVLAVDVRPARRSRTTRTNASSSARSGSTFGDRDLGDVAGEGRWRSRRSCCGCSTSDAGEGQPLGQVVELEHPLLADDRRAGAAWPGSASRRRACPVAPDGKWSSPKSRSSWVGVDPLGGLGVDARPAARRRSSDRMSTSCVREVDGHADVADAGRERARPGGS